MKRYASVLAIVAVFIAPCRVFAQVCAGECGAADSGCDERSLSVLALGRFGVAKTPFAAPLFPEVTGYRVFTFRVEAAYAISPSLRLGLRIPGVEAFVERPAGSIRKQAALGNVELSLSWRRPFPHGLAAGARFAVGAPTQRSARPSNDHFENAALALGSALEGWQTPELFAPGRVPLTPGVSVELDRGWLHSGAELKIPLLVRSVDGNSEPAVSIHPVAITPVLSAHVIAALWPWLRVVTRDWLVWNAVRAADLATQHPARLQLVLQPEVDLVITSRMLVAFDLTVPVSGALSGTYGIGLHLSAIF